MKSLHQTTLLIFMYFIWLCSSTWKCFEGTSQGKPDVLLIFLGLQRETAEDPPGSQECPFCQVADPGKRKIPRQQPRTSQKPQYPSEQPMISLLRLAILGWPSHTGTHSVLTHWTQNSREWYKSIYFPLGEIDPVRKSPKGCEVLSSHIKVLGLWRSILWFVFWGYEKTSNVPPFKHQARQIQVLLKRLPTRSNDLLCRPVCIQRPLQSTHSNAGSKTLQAKPRFKVQRIPEMHWLKLDQPPTPPPKKKEIILVRVFLFQDQNATPRFVNPNPRKLISDLSILSSVEHLHKLLSLPGTDT